MKQDKKDEKHMPLVKLVTIYWKSENSFLAQFESTFGKIIHI